MSQIVQKNPFCNKFYVTVIRKGSTAIYGESLPFAISGKHWSNLITLIETIMFILIYRFFFVIDTV